MIVYSDPIVTLAYHKGYTSKGKETSSEDTLIPEDYHPKYLPEVVEPDVVLKINPRRSLTSLKHLLSPAR